MTGALPATLSPVPGAAPGVPGLLVLKIGGSLLSDKRDTGETDYTAIDDYADLVAGLVGEFPGRVILVTGGGALCHPVGLRIKAAKGDPHAAVALTEPAFRMRWAWTTRLCDRGVRAVPLQVTAMMNELPDGTTATETAVVRRLLAEGALPVLSSDCVITAEGGLRILSSDDVPAVLLDLDLSPVRVVALTDVAGIHTGEGPGSPVLAHLDPDDLETARRLFWTDAWDATGAMEGKVEALAAHARRGAECVITRGERSAPSLRHLFAPLSTWPPDVPRTLIARRAPDPSLENTP
ncbi:amino acid kinase family protein [Streptomyces sp. DW26H14]|uniref:amino acid kinase family protein n=1 Tax=Streptomyces sp. DW26H14 TaxID=3435395 RepID=UPI00403DD90B